MLARKIFLFFLAFILVFNNRTIDAGAEELNVFGETAVLMEAATGQILWEKNKDIKRPPASTTKILTALVALEKENPDNLVTIGFGPPQVEGTRVYLVENEQQTLKNLLYGMLLNSGNDAALAVAEYLGGSRKEFAELMNTRAQEIGAKNSKFVNPHGLTEESHYTTAHDLALITREALRNDEFREIVRTKTRPWQGAEWESTLRNQNINFLSTYEGALGVKTGYTNAAGWCLVAAAERNGTTLIAVVLGSKSRQIVEGDVTRLLDYGFKNYQNVEIVGKAKPLITVSVSDQDLVIETASAVKTVVPLGEVFVPERKIRLEQVQAPIELGQSVGRVEYFAEGRLLGSTDLLATREIKAPVTIKDGLVRFALVILAFEVLNILIKLRCKKKRKLRFQAKQSSYLCF